MAFKSPSHHIWGIFMAVLLFNVSMRIFRRQSLYFIGKYLYLPMAHKYYAMAAAAAATGVVCVCVPVPVSCRDAMEWISCRTGRCFNGETPTIQHGKNVIISCLLLNGFTCHFDICAVSEPVHRLLPPIFSSLFYFIFQFFPSFFGCLSRSESKEICEFSSYFSLAYHWKLLAAALVYWQSISMP